MMPRIAVRLSSQHFEPLARRGLRGVPSRDDVAVSCLQALRETARGFQGGFLGKQHILGHVVGRRFGHKRFDHTKAGSFVGRSCDLQDRSEVAGLDQAFLIRRQSSKSSHVSALLKGGGAMLDHYAFKIQTLKHGTAEYRSSGRPVLTGPSSRLVDLSTDVAPLRLGAASPSFSEVVPFAEQNADRDDVVAKVGIGRLDRRSGTPRIVKAIDRDLVSPTIACRDAEVVPDQCVQFSRAFWNLCHFPHQSVVRITVCRGQSIATLPTYSTAKASQRPRFIA